MNHRPHPRSGRGARDGNQTGTISLGTRQQRRPRELGRLEPGRSCRTVMHFPHPADRGGTPIRKSESQRANDSARRQRVRPQVREFACSRGRRGRGSGCACGGSCSPGSGHAALGLVLSGRRRSRGREVSSPMAPSCRGKKLLRLAIAKLMIYERDCCRAWRRHRGGHATGPLRDTGAGAGRGGCR